MPPPEVAVITTAKQTITMPFEHSAIVQPSRVTEVRARVKGYLAERLFTEGQTVNEGDLLYRIEKDSFQADLDVAKARLESAEARLRYTEKEVKRLENLRKTGAVSQGDLDRAITEDDEARATLRLAKAEVAKWSLELSYTDIHAPISGVVGKSERDKGSFVGEQDNSLLTTVTRIDPIYTSFGVSERVYLNFRGDIDRGALKMPAEGMKFEMLLQDGSVIKGGRLNYEDVKFDVSMGTMQFRVEFPNPGGKIKPGQIVRVRIVEMERPDSIVIPQRCVNQSPAGAYVLVVGEGNTIEHRTVTLGPWIGDQWLIADGLKAGETVVADGMIRAFPGTKVTPVPYVAAAPPAAPAAPEKK